MSDSDDKLLDTSEKIEILSIDDDKLKLFGDLFSSKSSRKILNILYNNEMAASEIAIKTEMSLELVRHHLQKMQKIGLVKISKIKKNSREQDMKYYVSSKFVIMILPPALSEKAKKSKTLFNSLKKIYQFAAIGVSAIFSWFVIETATGSKITLDRPSGPSGIPDSVFWATITALLVIVVGLIIERIQSKKKSK